jgi:hypothetical protein
MDPRNGTILTAPGSNRRRPSAPIPAPATPHGIAGGRTASPRPATWPNIVVGPRFGVAYDISGNQSIVLRGGGGIFYDRPDGNTVFSIPGNPPIATSKDLRNSTLQTLAAGGAGLSPAPVPALVTFQYDAKVPASAQWQAGVQMAMPWATSLDVSYVGNHGYNRLGGLQRGNVVNLNAVDFGTAYLPQYQDLTKGAPTFAAQNSLTTNLLRPYQGYSTSPEHD